MLLLIIAVIIYLRVPRSSRGEESSVPPREKEILEEVKKLQDEFGARFGAKFSKEGFTSDQAYPFFLAANNSLNRFDKERETGLSSNALTEAKGYVALARLVLSWAQANGEDGIKRKAEEFLGAANQALERASHL